MASCTGSIERRTGPTGDTPREEGRPGVGGAPEIPGIDEPSGALEAVPLRRLSRAEYATTLRDLLGTEVRAEEIFSSDVSGRAGFPEGGPLSPDEIERMLVATEALVARYGAARLRTDLPCVPTVGDERGCATRFVTAFAARAYRHPPSAEELGDLMAVYDDARKGRGFEAALLLSVEAALLSPRFHYRWERSDDAPLAQGGIVTLGGYEIASRLSYLLWQSMPDAELFQAAKDGRLAQPEHIAAQARRMLKDGARAGEGLRSFWKAWLPTKSLETASTETPEGAAKRAHLGALLAFLDDLVFGAGDRRYATLLAGGYELVDGKHRAFADPARAGVFTQPAFLAATADTTLATVIHRGRFVYERLGSCASVPAPSGDIPDAPPRAPGASVREHLAMHATAPACRGCHQYMDAMGFAFDKFDANGKTREVDDYGRPVRTDGVMPLSSDVTLSFMDAADLLGQLASRPESAACFARQLAAYALRAPMDPDGERTRALERAFVAGGGDLVELLVDMTRQPAFSRRKPSEGEMLQ